MGGPSVSDINVFTIEFSNAAEGDDVQKDTVDPGISFSWDIRSGNDISTLSQNFDSDPLGGLLYVPTLPSNNTCANSTSFHVPSDTTRLDNLPAVGFDYIAIAPWTSGTCANAYLNATDRDQPSAVLFYLPNRVSLSNQTAAAPSGPADPVWQIDGSLQWQSTMGYPVYAINANEARLIMGELPKYAGDISQAPKADALLAQYSPSDSVRLYCNITSTETSGLPSLWVFLLVVMGMLAAIVLVTSVGMHVLQRRRRRQLRQLILSGQLDLQSLGIRLLTVPRDVIDTFPLFVYQEESKAEDSSPREAHPPSGKGKSIDSDPKAELDVNLPPASSLPHRSPPFPQPTCPICIDDFVADETIVRSLPCNHVFHPSCIDPMLLEYSTLCPLCKASALPAKYCPPVITNSMIRQQRAFRRRRGGRTQPVVLHPTNVEPAPGFSIRGFFRRTGPTANSSRPPGGDSSDLELGSVHSRTNRDTIDSAAEVATAGARPPSIPRSEWARHRASALFGRPARANASDNAITEPTPRWRRLVGAVFPVFA